MYARYNTKFAEYYALNIYPFFAEKISFITSRVKFSIAEFVIIAFILFFIIYVSVIIIKTINNRSIEYFKGFIINISVVLSIVYFLFVLFCGVNYHRYEFTHYSKLIIKQSSTKELINLCELLIKDANEQRELLSTSSDGFARLFDDSLLDTSNRAQKSFNRISEKYIVLRGNYPQPKLVYLSRAMSHMRITGVFFPFTFEANVNKDVPEYQIPSTMLHELVHLRGFMREDEANFISYLACINSGYADFSYSGTMLALNYCMNALYYEDQQAFSRLYNSYSDKVKNDLKYSANYWKQFESKVADISNKVNDSYLKANNQEDGVKSYGRMVDLLLAYYSIHLV